MRPKEVWEKTHSQRGPHEKRKRAPRARKQDSVSANNHAASDASNGTALHSDASSPPNEASPEEGARERIEQSPTKRQRASSVQIAPVTTKGNNMSDTTAAVALHRAIQSSPARLTGTQGTLIEVEDLTPKPIRRVLFPSPTQSNEGRALRNHDSNLKIIQHHQAPSINNPSPVLDQADKENCPPVDDVESVDNLFAENNEQSISRPTTPTPSSKLLAPSFKTPTRSSPLNRTPKTSDFFSSAARALLRPITTPKRTPTKSNTQPLGELTPFTAHLNSLLSDANNPDNNFDFPSLPSLNNSPNHTRNDFDFSQFDTQDFLSTDAPMPSSPPAWFGVYVDPVEQGDGLWSDYQLPEAGSPADEAGDGKTPKTPGLAVDENGHAL